MISWTLCLLAGLGGVGEGRWQELPLPDSPDPIRSMRFEEGGTLWILQGERLFYWDGQGFRPPRTDPGPIRAPMLGGFDRPLQAARRGDGNEGQLVRLTDGDCVFETAYYHDVPHEPAAVHVSRHGQRFTWGNRFLAVQVQGEWRRIEARLDHLLTFVLETEERVWFYFNGDLYSVDRDGEFRHREIECPFVDERGGERFHAALWGDDRFVVVQDGSQEVYAYSLETGESVPIPELRAELASTRLYDLFRGPDGALWLSKHDWDNRRFLFLRMDADGRVTTVEETSRLWWRNLRLWSHPESIVCASDGSIWFGSHYQGVGRHSRGSVKTWGWRDGVDGDIRFLAEGLNGTIYAASEDAVYRFDPAAPAARPPTWVSRWDELPLGFHRPFADLAGFVWWIHPDRPEVLTRWDGEAWEEVEVPFDPRRFSRWLADEQGHLMVTMNRYPDGCYDVSGDGVHKFQNLHEMLAAAYRRGAHQFRVERSLQGCVRTEDELWFGYQGHRSVHVFDGQRWTELHLGQPVSFLLESAAHGVIARTRNDEFYLYDRGQMVRLDHSLEGPGRWLLGERSWQPFEAALFQEHPDEYAVVERRGREDWSLLAPMPASDWRTAAELPEEISRVTRARHGHWSTFPRSPRWRILGDTLVAADLRNSPLANRARAIEDIFEDRRGNVWFVLKLSNGYTQTFLLRTADFRLAVESEQVTAGRSLSLSPDVTVGDEPVESARLFWRFKGGTWRGGAVGESVTPVFPRSGTYEIELLAMNPLGAVTPEPVTLHVEARVRSLR